jgi:hypothetical protein
MKTKFSFLAMLFALIFAVPAYAQWQFIKTTHSIGNEHATCIKVDALGSIYCAGMFTDSIFSQGNLLVASGSEDGYIERSANSGSIIWSKKVGGVGADVSIYGIDTAGTDLYAVGFFQGAVSMGAFTINSSGYDMFVLKLNAIDGSLIWLRSYGGTGNQIATAIAYEPNTNALYVTGSSDTVFTLGSTTLANAGNYDLFAAKLDTSGNVLWALTGGSNDMDLGMSIAVDQSGNCTIAGQYYANATFGTQPPLINYGVPAGCLIKCSANGAFMWAHSMCGGAGENDPYGVAVDASDNNYVCGRLSGTINFGNSVTLTVNLATSGYVAKYDQAGNCLWAKKVAENDGGCFAIALSSVGVVTTGYFNNTCVFGSTTLTSTGSGDVFVTGFDQNGMCMWSVQAGDVGSDEAFAITTDNNGNAYVAGDFRGSMTMFGSFGDSNADPNGNTFEAYFAKLGMPTGIADANTSTASINAFPNPFADHLTVPLSDDQSCVVIITDMSGREVERTESERTSSLLIDCRDLPSGIYLLSVRDEQNVLIGTAKVIKQ